MTTMTTSLSTRVKRITLNQWRYYYNKFLFVERPLNANFLKGLLPLVEHSSESDSERGSGRCSEGTLGKALTIEVELRVSDDEIAPKAVSHGLTPHELLRNELTKYEITRQRLESTLNQETVPNIYSDKILNKCPNHDPATVVALPVSQDSHAMHSLVDINSPIINSVSSFIGLFEGQIASVDSQDVTVPISLTRVSSLLATFL